MRIKWIAAASLCAATLAMGSGAHAAKIVRTYDIHATRFVQTFGADPTPPQVSANLNVTLEFDNTANVATTTTGLKINSFDLPYGAEFQYFSASDVIALATVLAGPASCSPEKGSFCAFIHQATSAAPTLVYFNHSLPTSPQNVWVAENLSLTFSDADRGEMPGVPEPGTWAMLLLGFGGIGTMLRRRQQRISVAG